MHHDEAVEALAVLQISGAVLVLAAGDARSAVWITPEVGPPTRIVDIDNDDLAVEHAALLVEHDDTFLAMGSPDGFAVHGVRDGITRRLNIRTDLPVTRISTITGPTPCFLVGDEDGGVHTVPVSYDDPSALNSALGCSYDAGGEVTALGCLPGARRAIFAAARTGRITLWDPETGSEPVARVELPEPPDLVTAIDGGVALTCPGGVILWRPVDSNLPPVRIPLTAARISHMVCLGRDPERLVCASTSGTLHAINTRTNSITELNLNTELLHLVGLRSPAWVVGSHGSAVLGLQLIEPTHTDSARRHNVARARNRS